MKKLIEHCIQLLYNNEFRKDIYQLRKEIYKNLSNVYPKPPMNFFKSFNKPNELVEYEDLHDVLTNDQEFINNYKEVEGRKISKLQRGRKKKGSSYEDSYYIGYYGYELIFEKRPIDIYAIRIVSNEKSIVFLKLYSPWYSKVKGKRVTQSFLNYYFDIKKYDSKTDYTYLSRRIVTAGFPFNTEGKGPGLYNKIIKKWNYKNYTSMEVLYDGTMHRYPMASFIDACCVFKLETIHPKYVLPPFSKQIIFIGRLLKELEITKFKFDLLLKELKKPNSKKQDLLNILYSDKVQSKFYDLFKNGKDIPLILIPGFLPSEQEWSKLRKDLKNRNLAQDDSTENLSAKFMLYLEKKEFRITYKELAARHYKDPEWYDKYEDKKDDEGLDFSDYEIKHRLKDTFKTSIANLIKEHGLTRPKRGKRKK